jgi:hypothetical protein
VTVVDSKKPTYIIIDGVDECERGERREICSWFINRVNLLAKEDFGALRCLFASQEDGFAKKDLGTIPAIEMFPVSTRNDIKRYITFWQAKIEGKHGKLDRTGASSPLVDLILSGTQGETSLPTRNFLTSPLFRETNFKLFGCMSGMFLYAKLMSLYLYGLPQRQDFVKSVQPGHFPQGLDEL